MGTGREERPPFAKRSAAEVAWAAEHLPAEHPGFVVVAMGMLELTGERVTRNSVLARLKATGRDRTAVNAQAKRLGQKEPLA
jgi:hypothetical protein